MDQFIESLSTRLNVAPDAAREAVKILLQFAQKYAAGTDFEKLISQIPGATELLGEPVKSEGSNPLAGLLGGFLGGQTADAAKAFANLQAVGLSTPQITAFVQAFVEKSREVAGPEVIDGVIARIPALQSFLKTA